MQEPQCMLSIRRVNSAMRCASSFDDSAREKVHAPRLLAVSSAGIYDLRSTLPQRLSWSGRKGEQIMQREFPECPLVGVGAVVVDNNRVLLVRRGTEPLRGHW